MNPGPGNVVIGGGRTYVNTTYSTCKQCKIWLCPVDPLVTFSCFYVVLDLTKVNFVQVMDCVFGFFQ